MRRRSIALKVPSNLVLAEHTDGLYICDLLPQRLRERERERALPSIFSPVELLLYPRLEKSYLLLVEGEVWGSQEGASCNAGRLRLTPLETNRPLSPTSTHFRTCGRQSRCRFCLRIWFVIFFWDSFPRSQKAKHLLEEVGDKRNDV